MAELGTTRLTYSELAKRLGPDGKIAEAVNILAQTNEMIDDMVVTEGNLPNGHQIAIKTAITTPVLRMYNQGVSPTTGKSGQIVEPMAMLEDRSEADKDLAELNGNVGQFRMDEAETHLEGMNQRFQESFIYGSAATPGDIIGFAPRYSDLSGGNADNILDGGGTGSDNLSIFLVGWHKKYCHAFHPKGAKVGLLHEDLGIIDAFDADNKRFRAYSDWFQWKFGLAVGDWRYVVRIANIDVSNLVNESSAANLIKLMSKSIDRIPSRSASLSFYCNATVTSMLRIQGLNNSTSAVEVQRALDQFGRVGSISFLGIPVKRVDQMLNTEERVV